MHRVDADEICAAPGRMRDELPKIGEVTDTPVLIRAERVELGCESPGPSVRAQNLRLVAARRRDDQCAIRRQLHVDDDLERVISARQRLGQDQQAPRNRPTVDLAPLALRERFRVCGALDRAAVLEPHAPGDRTCEKVARQRERDAHPGRPQHHHCRQQYPPAFRLDRIDLARKRRCVAQIAAHRREQRVARRGTEVAELAAIVEVCLADATQGRQALLERLELVPGRVGLRTLSAHSACDSSSTVLRGSSGSVPRLRSIRAPGPG